MNTERESALVLYYKRENRYSLNALLGAIEIGGWDEKVEIWTPSEESALIKTTNSLVRRGKSTIIGLSFSTPQLWEMEKLVQTLRSECGEDPLYIAGGPHPTGDPIGALQMGFDLIVRGEGEETLLELLEVASKNGEYAGVKGIGFFETDEEYQFTGKREPIDLNAYPPFPVKNPRFGPIEITRGCPYVCYFCQTPQLFGATVHHRDVDVICQYADIMAKNERNDMRFITPNAFSYGSLDGREVNIAAIHKLLHSMREVLGSDGRIFFGSFPSEVRPEHVNKETVRLVVEYADNDNLVIGGQSGSQRILDLCHRGHTVEDIYNAVELILKSGLKANVDFIFGLPGETQQDVDLTLKTIEDLVTMGARIHAHTFTPLPQTPYWKEPGGRISAATRKVIGSLTGKGAFYGDWEEQEVLAAKIEKYVKRTAR